MTAKSRGRAGQAWPPRAGFTLIELLAALAVLGLVLGTLSLSIRSGLTAYTRASRVSESTAALEGADNALRHLIEGIDPGDESGPARFAGTASGFECITAMPGNGSAPIHRMWSKVFVDGTHRLVVRWRPYLHAVPSRPRPFPMEVELLSNVSGIELDYWYPGTGWASAWRSSELPLLVRIRLRFPPGDTRHWPDVVAAPLLDRR